MPDYTAVYRGIVADRADPEKRGRVRVQVPQIFGGTPTDWAEPTSPTADLPALRSTVWVLFQGGDIRRPVYVSGAPPAVSLPTNLMTTDTTQTVTGAKDFTGGLTVSGSPVATATAITAATDDTKVLVLMGAI